MGRQLFDMTTPDNQRWVAFQTEQWRKQAVSSQRDEVLSAPFITISREFACSGFALGELLALELNKSGKGFENTWAVYDKLLLEKVEDEYGIHKTLLASFTETTRDEISDFFSSYLSSRPTQTSIYQKMFMTIRALAIKGFVILIGRGAAVATKGLKNGFHIRVFAPAEWKIKQIMKLQGISSEKEAKKSLEKATRDREMFVQKYLKEDINKASTYHLMINNAMFQREEIVDVIIDIMTKKGYFDNYSNI